MQEKLVVTDRQRTALAQLIKAAEIIKIQEDLQEKKEKAIQAEKDKVRQRKQAREVFDHAWLDLFQPGNVDFESECSIEDEFGHPSEEQEALQKSKFKLNVIPTEIDTDDGNHTNAFIGIKSKKKKKHHGRKFN